MEWEEEHRKRDESEAIHCQAREENRQRKEEAEDIHQQEGEEH